MIASYICIPDVNNSWWKSWRNLRSSKRFLLLFICFAGWRQRWPPVERRANNRRPVSTEWAENRPGWGAMSEKDDVDYFRDIGKILGYSGLRAGRHENRIRCKFIGWVRASLRVIGRSVMMREILMARYNN